MQVQRTEVGEDRAPRPPPTASAKAYFPSASSPFLATPGNRRHLYDLLVASPARTFLYCSIGTSSAYHRHASPTNEVLQRDGFVLANSRARRYPWWVCRSEDRASRSQLDLPALGFLRHL